MQNKNNTYSHEYSCNNEEQKNPRISEEREELPGFRNPLHCARVRSVAHRKSRENLPILRVRYLMETTFVPCVCGFKCVDLWLSFGHRARRNQLRFRHRRGLWRLLISAPILSYQVQWRVEFAELSCVDWSNYSLVVQ